MENVLIKNYFFSAKGFCFFDLCLSTLSSDVNLIYAMLQEVLLSIDAKILSVGIIVLAGKWKGQT